MSTSRPAANINNSLPKSEKKLAIGLSFAEHAENMRPQDDPGEQQPNHPREPDAAGSGGTPTMIAMTMANFARGGSVRIPETSIIEHFHLAFARAAANVR